MTEAETDKKPRLLIVEDEIIIATDLKRRLGNLGYEVCAAVHDGKAAVKSAGRLRPDLVLMDIELGGAPDGIETAEKIRSNLAIPIVFLTAYADEKRLARAKLTLPFGYILKPFQDKDLKVTLDMALYVARVDAERKKVEESLRLFQAIVESSSEAIAVSGKDGKLVYLNPAHEKLFGRSLEEARRTGRRAYYPPESAEVLDREVTPALIQGKSWEGVLEVFDVSGRRFPLWQKADAIRDDQGRLLYTFGFMHDITAQKQMVEALRSEKEMAQRSFEVAEVMLLLIGAEGRVRLINE
ncbi:MAG: response regulator [Thermodesulfobacteriota bacterium]